MKTSDGNDMQSAGETTKGLKIPVLLLLVPFPWAKTAIKFNQNHENQTKQLTFFESSASALV